jgi:hypothetical protein
MDRFIGNVDDRIHSTFGNMVCLSKGSKGDRILLTTFSLDVLFSLELAGISVATTERVSLEGYPVLPVATASSGGDGGDEGGGGDTDGSADFQPDSDTDEEI